MVWRIVAIGALAVALVAGVTSCTGDCTDKLACGPQGAVPSTSSVTATVGSGGGGSSAGPGGGGMAAGGSGGMPAVVPIDLCAGLSTFRHSCAVMSTGQAFCWGNNSDGQLGDGTTQPSLTPVLVASTADYTEIACGNGFTCARKTAGGVDCWGRNTSGELGQGSFSAPMLVPSAVIGVGGAEQISSGSGHTCARNNFGELWCWGDNVAGQLGVASPPDSATPLKAGLSGIEDLGAGLYHTCVTLSAGSVWCWGDNNYGQLGDGTNDISASPVQVVGITNASRVSGGRGHSCALLDTGAVVCWGTNSFGALGHGQSGGGSNVPVTVVGLSGVVSLDVGFQHSCALLNDGSMRCWGWNEFGQLGNGTNTNSNVIVQVAGISERSLFDSGYVHTCAIDAGAMKCWGENTEGQLGNGNMTNTNVPVSVAFP